MRFMERRIGMLVTKGKWKKLRKTMGGICLVGAVAVSGMQINPVTAATKTSLSVKKVTISLGKQKASSITVNNKVKGATYTFKTSNAKIVKVTAKGVLTGVKAGKAKITVSQKLKKKVTKVGVVNVTVKQASAVKKNPKAITTGRGKIAINLLDYVKNPSIGAKYELVSNNKKIASSVTLQEKNAYKGNIQLKTVGKVVFSVNETYNKKKRNLCKITVNVKGATFDKSAFEKQYKKVDTEVKITPMDFMKYTTASDKITFGISDTEGEVMVLDGNEITTVDNGTAILTVYNNGKVIATSNITVEYVKVTGVKASSNKVNIYIGETDDECIQNLTIETIPAGAKLTNVNVSVLNEDICTVNYFPEDENVIQVIGGEEGTTAIVVSNAEGETLATIPVTVINAVDAKITGIKFSTNKLSVNMDEQETTFTMETLPSYAYINNCILEVEDNTICDATMEVDEQKKNKATVYVSGFSYGATNILVKNEEDVVIGKLPVVVADAGYKTPTSVTILPKNTGNTDDEDGYSLKSTGGKYTVTVQENSCAEVYYKLPTGKAEYVSVANGNEDVCTVNVQSGDDDREGIIEITPISIGSTNVEIKNFDGTVLKTLIVVVEETKE